MPNLATDLARVMEELAERWERIADEHGVRQFTGDDHRLFANELRATLTAWNTRAASGGDVAIKTDRSFTPNLEEPASLEQRARELFDAMMDAAYGDTTIGNIVCAETTRGRLEAAWLPLITAALANQQGVEKDAARYQWLRDSRACSLEVSFNDHHNMYMSVSDTLENLQEYYDDISAAEREKMVATDTIWTVHIYPNTPVGFNVYHAATLDAAIDAAMSTQPAGDVGRERA